MANARSYGHRTIYVKDHDLWEFVVSVARQQDISVSSLIEDALINYLRPVTDAEIKIQRIKEILGD